MKRQTALAKRPRALEETSLALLTRADELLVQATTILKAKELRDLAFTAADFAKRKGMGLQNENRARGLGYRATRRIGELWVPAPKAKGTRGQLIGRGVIGGAPGDPPISGPPYQKKPTGSPGYPRREPPAPRHRTLLIARRLIAISPPQPIHVPLLPLGHGRFPPADTAP